MTPQPSDLSKCRESCYQAVASVVSLDAQELDSWISLLEHQEAIGCFTDPTGWINTQHARSVSLRMLRALRTCQKELLNDQR